MTHDQIQKAKNIDQDPILQGRIDLSWEINKLRQDPDIGCEDLFSSNKMESNKYPDKPGVRVAPETPIETAVSERSDIKQSLMAVIALGQNIALGVVRGRNESGNEANYVSLLNNSASDNEGRARIIDILKEGTPVTITRGGVEQVVGHEGAARGVSSRHCTIELKDGILTVIDETSTNGTSVFTNITQDQARHYVGIEVWSQPSVETEKLINDRLQAEKLLKASHLGRFTINT